MNRSRIRFLEAFASGAIVGALIAVVEHFSLFAGWQWRAAGVATYALLGGCAAGLIEEALGRFLPRQLPAWRVTGVLAPFVVLDTVYWINDRFLAGDPYFSASSLTVTAFSLLAVLGLCVLFAWKAGARTASLFQPVRRVPFGVAALLVVVATLWLSLPGEGMPSRHASKGAGDPQPPNLVLVVMDAARADRLGFYGYPQPTSPALDRTVNAGRIYDRAFAGSSWTAPSVRGILMPTMAGANRPFSTVPTALRERGYRTACFSDNPFLAFDQRLVGDFQVVRRSAPPWQDLFRATTLGHVLDRLQSRQDHLLVDEALDWAFASDQRFFLYLHLMNSHAPYSREPLDGKKRGGRGIVSPATELHITGEDAEDVAARYDASLRSTTDEVARVLGRLSRSARPFVFILTADHGESLGEGGRWGHGGTLAPELLHVPMVVIGQGVAPGRVVEPIGHESISRTLLSAAGQDCRACFGSDLRTSNGDAIIEGMLPPDLSYRIRGHYIGFRNQRTGVVRLFDFARDPRMTADLHSAQPDLARQMVEGLRASAFPYVDDLREQQLRSLGYIGGAGSAR